MSVGVTANRAGSGKDDRRQRRQQTPTSEMCAHAVQNEQGGEGEMEGRPTVRRRTSRPILWGPGWYYWRALVLSREGEEGVGDNTEYGEGKA